ncbi:MAG: ABC transporter permease [Polyangiaceae bacterium]|nr:ABC transporter permease [Polyangiaceae bacterium]
MPFEWFVALRFLREGRMQTVLILAGVGFGVGVMVFLSALINGLQASLIQQTLSVQAHVVVREPEEQARVLDEPTARQIAQRRKVNQRVAAIDRWEQALERIRRVPGVVSVAPTVAGSAFIRRGNVSSSVALRGVDPDQYDRIVPISSRLVSGRFRLIGSEAVIGSELASDLGAGIGDKLRVESTQGRSDVLTVSGIFDVGNKDVNQRWVFVSIRAAQTLLDLPNRISTVEVTVDDVFEADAIGERIASATGLDADSWMKINRQLLVALKSQSSSSVMIQFFVILAVALGIASVLVVSVLQKSKEIGILRATGTSVNQIMSIFFIEGGLVGTAGSVVGVAVGTVLALLFARMAVNPDGSPTFPVDLNAMLFARSVLVATGVGLASAVFPARRAATLDPAVAIHHG